MLTVEQNIAYFAAIKGIHQNRLLSAIEEVIEKLDLHMHRNKAAGTLSGGNKRKLSVAIAIVGNPPIILLDEPSAGMDPQARRWMWKVISTIAQTKTSGVILTTHLMEEAEALSTKMGIMVQGGIFQCMGSAQHIKNKFGGDKYELEIKLKIPSIEQLRQEIALFDLSKHYTAKKTDIEEDFEEDTEINIGSALEHLKSTGMQPMVLQ